MGFFVLAVANPALEAVAENVEVLDGLSIGHGRGNF